jgi:hypothetical protein
MIRFLKAVIEILAMIALSVVVLVLLIVYAVLYANEPRKNDDPGGMDPG